MFLRCSTRKKDGKVHRYWSVVENRRVDRRRVVQKTLLYLGEINDAQHVDWLRAIEALDGEQPRQLTLLPEDRPAPAEVDAVHLKMSRMKLLRPRQWGACWLSLALWGQLQLDAFWRKRLPASREGTDWLAVLKVLTVYRLLDPGSEWRLHRLWYQRSAMADLLGTEFGVLGKDTLYRCLDKLLVHKEDLFAYLRGRWTDLFGARYEVLLYDLTSTYFESDPPFPEGDKRRHGYSRDKRPDCVQVVIALIVTPEGLPLAYEVLPGNTADRTTLRAFLQQIQSRYGQAERIWIMDRGIPTEEVLAEMRTADPPIHYLVGTPKGRLSQYEQRLLEVDWQKVREGVEVKLSPENGELYVLARSGDRVHKERAMRRRQLKKLWKRLGELQRMKLPRDRLMLKLGGAFQQAPVAVRLVRVQTPPGGGLRFELLKDRLRQVRLREGRYLLRTNLTETDPARLWNLYMQLSRVEEAFRNLKGDLAVRPVYHQKEERIEAHIFVAFLAYCLHATLTQRLRVHAGGLTPRSILEQLKGILMLDVEVPTTDGRWLHMSRYTQPDAVQRLLLAQLRMPLPAQPPPRITQERSTSTASCSEDLLQ
jgi:hypothetical protein